MTGLFISLAQRTSKKADQEKFSNYLIPFSTSLPSNGEPPTTATNISRTDPQSGSQISCPVGYSINIIGAFYQVNDPYGECNYTGKTTPNTNAVFTQTCSDPTSSSYDPVLCANLDTNFYNTVCSPSNGCAIRDVSAYLGNLCDGKQDCNVTMNSANLGPYPCGGLLPLPNTPFTTTTPRGSSGSPTYYGLPAIPTNTTGQYTVSGASVHGIYTCLPTTGGTTATSNTN